MVTLEFQELLENIQKRIYKTVLQITNASPASRFLSYTLNTKVLIILSLQKKKSCIYWDPTSCGNVCEIHSWLSAEECLHTALYIVYKKKKKIPGTVSQRDLENLG